MKAPLRFSLLRYLIEQSRPAAPRDIFERLKTQYGRERQFRLSYIEEHLESLRGVGLVEVVGAAEEGDRLVLSYQVTEYGQSRGRYLARLET